MDSEAALLRQAAATKKANPAAHVFVYRNSVHAMPWFATVREKLIDPLYAGFFLQFGQSPPRANGSYYSPPCDNTTGRCSRLYHDQTQTPSTLPTGDGICTGQCDCGDGLPCGMYLFNHANGTMFREWLVNEYFLGPTAAGSPLISGLFIDDYWCAASDGPCPLRAGNRLVGPAETERHVLDDLGMSAAEVDVQARAWRTNMDVVFSALLAHNTTSWDQMYSNSYNVPDANAMTVPRPTVIWQQTCEAVLSKECSAPTTSAAAAAQPPAPDDTPCCCATAACPVACPAHCPFLRNIPLFYGLNYTNKEALSSARVADRLPMLSQDLAAFLLLRGDWAWLGFGFVSCHNNTNYTQPSEFANDYGEPTETCSALGRGVFRRKYTKSTVQLDCRRWKASISLEPVH